MAQETKKHRCQACGREISQEDYDSYGHVLGVLGRPANRRIRQYVRRPHVEILQEQFFIEHQ